MSLQVYSEVPLKAQKCSEEVPEDGKKANTTLYSGRSKRRTQRTTSWSASPSETDKTTNLETIFKHIEENKRIGISQHGFMKGKHNFTKPHICLT